MVGFFGAVLILGIEIDHDKQKSDLRCKLFRSIRTINIHIHQYFHQSKPLVPNFLTMVKRKKSNTSGANGRTTNRGTASQSRSKDSRFGDEHCQQSSPQKDPSPPSLLKLPHQTTNISKTSLATSHVTDHSRTTAITSSLSSSSMQQPTASSSIVESGKLYNLRLKILCKKAGKHTNTTNCVVVLSSAIEQIQKDDIAEKIRNVCVNVDQQLRLKSQESKLALEYGSLPSWTLRSNKEVHCKFLLAAFSLFERLTKCYQECDKSIMDYDTIERAFSRIIAIIMNVDDEVEQERSLTEEKKLGCKVLETIRVGEEEFKRKYMEGGGSAPAQGYDRCPFCKHYNVDSPPSNIQVEKDTERELARYKRQSQ